MNFALELWSFDMHLTAEHGLDAAASALCLIAAICLALSKNCLSMAWSRHTQVTAEGTWDAAQEALVLYAAIGAFASRAGPWAECSAQQSPALH